VNKIHKLLNIDYSQNEVEGMTDHSYKDFILFYFFKKQTNKQTNKQKNEGITLM